MLRIDTHHHIVPPDYRNALRKAGIDEAGGRAVPDWSPDAVAADDGRTRRGHGHRCRYLPRARPSCPNASDASALARDVNDYSADLVASQPDRFGFFATVPMPHVAESVAETVRALDELNADGVVLLANNEASTSARTAKTTCSPRWTRARRWSSSIPPSCPAPPCPVSCRSPPTSCLDTTRAAYLLVRNGIRQQVPEHPLHPEPCRRVRPLCVAPDGHGDHERHRAQPRRHPRRFLRVLLRHRVCRRAPPPCRRCWRSPSRDTSPSAPTSRSHPLAVGKLFAAGLETYPADRRRQREPSIAPTRWRCSRDSARAPAPAPPSRIDTARHIASRIVMRGVARLISTR